MYTITFFYIYSSNHSRGTAWGNVTYIFCVYTALQFNVMVKACGLQCLYTNKFCFLCICCAGINFTKIIFKLFYFIICFTFLSF